VALYEHNTVTESGRELFKGLKDVASLLVCTFLGFEQLSILIGGGAMALARQPKTAGFRLKSRYDIFVDRLSKCYWFSGLAI